MSKIKICGLRREEDIQAVNQYRPDYIGYVFARRKRLVTEETAAALTAMLDPEIVPVGVFVNAEQEMMVRLAKNRTIRIIQLHGQETVEAAEALRKELDVQAPGTKIIKALRMEPDTAEAMVREWEKSSVDYLLLDTGIGGTGITFDHTILDRITPIGKEWFLAGGMHAGNIPDAVQNFHPYAIDVSSGAETDGWKDSEKIKKIIEIVREQR